MILKSSKWLLPIILPGIWILIYFNLQSGTNYLIDDIFRMQSGTRFAESFRFFIFEVPKVLMLLVLIIFVVGIIRSFFTAERTRKALEGRSLFAGNVMASMLGIVTPFCSCSAIPLFLGFVESGIPLGVTFSFLIAAPMINEIAVVLLFGMFGWKVALVYVVTGLIIAIASGLVIGRLKLERFVESWVYEMQVAQVDAEVSHIPFTERIMAGRAAVVEIVLRVWPYVLAGIAVGAGIHGYVPEGFMASFMGKGAWWAVPAAVLLGVPMYSNAAGIIPIVHALLEKGAALGTVLAFMMAVIGLSLPEMIILRNVLKKQLIAVFVGVVATGIVIVGYLFNFIF